MASERGSGALGASFRDPCGHMLVADGVLYRHVAPSYRDDYQRLTESGLYRRLVDGGKLVAHDEVDATAVSPSAFKLLRPQQLPFISYPYEWCFGALKAAALLTLEIERIALEHDMSLKDASAFNIQFVGCQPILIDTLSFTALDEGSPWIAYRQFCQHFLAPLALIATRDARLGQLTRTHLDGVPLELATRLLSWRTRLRPRLLLHLQLHAWGGRALAGETRQHPIGRHPIGRHGRLGLLDSLHRAVEGIRWRPPTTTWSTYTDRSPYDGASLEDKRRRVGELLDRVEPRTVLDLGANDGDFSRLAAERGAYVVAVDGDAATVEACYQKCRGGPRRDILPLIVDLANPSPALGWNHRERMSLAERAPVDLVLALALVHHLVVGNNVPLTMVAEWLATLGRWLVIELVPPQDAMVQAMRAGRRGPSQEYDRGSFERAFASRFDVVERTDVGTSGRALYLMRRTGS